LKNKIFFILATILCASCTIEVAGPIDEPVARVNDKYLYKENLKKLFRQKVSDQDSITIAKNYIDNWVEEQLMLSKAELNLSDEEKDVQEKLNDYRNSLLIYKYQENYIKQNLDTLVTLEEIKKYYNENHQNFRLENNLVKALYVKLPEEIPNADLYRVKRWLSSSNEEDEQNLYNYCSEYAENFDDFDNDWVLFNMIQLQFPSQINNPDNRLRWRRYFETRDTAYLYYLRIDDFLPKSEIAPLEYIDEKIKGIILNKRKVTLVKELESNIYNEAMNREMIQIY